MAGTYGSVISFSIPCNQFTISRAKPLLSISSSIPISSRSKPTRRKNHLRIKILKTLTKPPPFTVSPIPPQSESEIPIVLPEISTPSGVEAEVSSRLSVGSNAASLLNFDLAQFSWGSFFRYGFYFLAVFAFQTICTVWVLGYGNSIKGDNNSDDKALNVRSKNGNEVLLNGNERIVIGNFGSETNKLVYLEESKMRGKIEEIRLMAREARKKEKNKTSNDFEEEDMEGRNENSRARIGIEKEVDARIVKLQKRLNSAKERIPESPVNYLLKSENVEDAVERNDLKGEEKNKSLIFKKKLKYRNSSSDRLKKPKGFRGFVSNGKKSGSNGNSTTVEDANFAGDNMGEKDTEKRVDKGIKESVSEKFKDNGTNLASDELILQRETDRTNLNIGIKGLSSKNKPSNGNVSKSQDIFFV